MTAILVLLGATLYWLAAIVFLTMLARGEVRFRR